MKKDIRLKIYEKLGIKKFRQLTYKVAFFLEYFLSKKKYSKEEIKRHVYQEKINYNIGPKKSLESLQEFKKYLFYNAFIHLLFPISSLFIFNALSFSHKIILLIINIPNIYCVMLQDYNRIRINYVLKKFSCHTANQISELKSTIEELNKDLNNPKYKLVHRLPFNYRQEKVVHLSQILNKLTKEELIAYQANLKLLKSSIANNSHLTGKDTAFFLQDHQYLVLELKK